MVCRFASGGTERFQRTVPRFRARFGGFSHKSWLAPFATVGHRGQKRAVCFQHEPIWGRCREGLADIGAVFECKNSGEADKKSCLEHPFHRLQAFGKAVENAFCALGERLHLLERILK